MKKRGKPKTFTAPASIWKRVLAFIIDLLVLDLIVIAPFRSLIEKTLSLGEGATYSELMQYIAANPEVTAKFTSVMVIITVIALLYFTILETKIRQTLGKALMGIYLISETEDKQITFWRCLLSNLTFIPFFPFIILWVVDPFYMLTSQKSQRFMEKFSKIVVVEDYSYDAK